MTSSRFKDITGETFGRLTALERVLPKNGRTAWLCQCECGNQPEVLLNSLVTGNTISCGCARAKHQGRGTRAYQIWLSIKSRCFNPNVDNFKYYGGRGITMCDVWVKDFQSFYEHIGEPPGEEYSLGRIDIDGNYEPGNVKWATKKEQIQNRRTSTETIEYQGRSMAVSEWAEETGIPYRTLLKRLRRGWDIERALTTPVRKLSASTIP